MSILSRFNQIIKANINDLIDKCEDPGKMIEQYLRELTENLADVKNETAAVMAEETKAKRMLDENEKEIEKYENLAKKAVEEKNDDDARTFLAKKQDYVTKKESLQSNYDVAKENARKMREMHDKLVKDIDDLNRRKESVKAKVAIAKTQEKVNKITSGTSKSENATTAFERMENKANQMLDKANALGELNQEPVDEAKELEKKYAAEKQNKAIDDELAALKAKMKK